MMNLFHHNPGDEDTDRHAKGTVTDDENEDITVEK